MQSHDGTPVVPIPVRNQAGLAVDQAPRWGESGGARIGAIYAPQHLHGNMRENATSSLAASGATKASIEPLSPRASLARSYPTWFPRACSSWAPRHRDFHNHSFQLSWAKSPGSDSKHNTRLTAPWSALAESATVVPTPGGFSSKPWNAGACGAELLAS